MLRMIEQHLFEIVSALVSIGISWGIIITKTKNQEKEIDELKGQIKEMQEDHDLVIRIDTKVDGLADSIKELKEMIESKRSKK